MPFQHQLHAGQLLQAAHILPGRSRRVGRAGDSIEHGAVDGSAAGRTVARRTLLRRIEPPETFHALGVPPAEHVDGPHHHGAARGFGAPDHLFGFVPPGGHVELIPRRPAERPRHVFHGKRSHVGQNLQRLLGLGGARHSHFSIGMKRALPAHGTQEDRRIPDCAEQFGAQIGLADIHQPPRLELVVREPRQVGLQRGVVIHTAGQKAPVRRPQRLPRGGLEIHHAEGVLRVGDGCRGLRPGARKQRTGRQKPQELTPIPGKRIHDRQRTMWRDRWAGGSWSRARSEQV